MSAIGSKRKSDLKESVESLNEEFSSGDYGENVAKFVTDLRDTAKVLFGTDSILSAIERMTTNKKLTPLQFLFVQDIVLNIKPVEDDYVGKVKTSPDLSVYVGTLTSNVKKVNVAPLRNHSKYSLNAEITMILRNSNLNNLLKIVTLYHTLDLDVNK